MISHSQILDLLISPSETWVNGSALFWDDWKNKRPFLTWIKDNGIGQIYYKIHGECCKRGWITHAFYDNTLFYDNMKKHWKTFWPNADPKIKGFQSIKWKLEKECIIPRDTLDIFITLILLPSLNDWYYYTDSSSLSE